MHLNEYMNAPTKHEKSLVVTKVLGIIHDVCPVGTFVTFENGRWWEVSHRSSREKVGTFFRDMLADKYKSSAKNKVIQRRQKRNQTSAAAKKEEKSTDTTKTTTTDIMAVSMANMKNAMLASRLVPEASSSSSSTGSVDMSKLHSLSAPASLTANLSTEREKQMQLNQFGAPIMPSMRQVLASQFLPISSLAGTAGADDADTDASAGTHHRHNSPMEHQYPQSAPASPVSSSTHFAPIFAQAASTPDVRSLFTTVLPTASSSSKPQHDTNVAAASLTSLIPCAEAEHGPVLENLEDHLAMKVMAELAMTDVDDPSLTINDNTEPNNVEDFTTIGGVGFFDVDDLAPASL